MVTTRLYVLLCLILGCTCEPGPESPPPRIEESPFLFAPLSVTPEAVPARFGASLPTNAEAWRRWGEEFPPRAHVEDLLPSSIDMRHRFATAVAAALRGGDSMEDVLTIHGAMVRWLEPDECEWLGEWATHDETPARARPFFWIEFASCMPFGDAGDDPFARDDLPPRAVLARFVAQINEDQTRELSPRLVETLRLILEQESETRDFSVSQIGLSLLLRFEGGVGEALRLRRGFPAAARAIDPLFQGETHPEAARFFASYCRRSPETRECRAGGPRWTRSSPVVSQTTTPTTAPLAEEVRRYDFDALSFVENHPLHREDVREELAACAGGDTYSEYLCLKQLALLDRTLARELAMSFGSGAFAEMSALLRTLREEEEGALGVRMQDMSLIASIDARAVTPVDLLRLDGRALQFDMETGVFPNEHDSLLRRLAALAPRVLGETVFREDASEDAGVPYRLHAWRDGQRWSTNARNLGDWYDVDAVVGMLNTLSRSAESAIRWLVLGSEDQTLVVVAGPEDALKSALREGLVVAAESAETQAASLEAAERAFQEL